MAERQERGRGQAGAAALELVFALPVTLLFVLGIMEFGRIIWTQTTLDYAVEAAARCAAINSTLCGTTTAIKNFAVGAATGIPVTSSNFTVATPSCGAQVSATFHYAFSVPWLFPQNLTLSSTSCFPTP